MKRALGVFIHDHPLVFLVGIGVCAQLTGRILSLYFGCHYQYWFDDTLFLLIVAMTTFLGLVLSFELANFILIRLTTTRLNKYFRIHNLAGSHHIGIFRLGLWPMTYLLITTIFTLSTSNFTLLFLQRYPLQTIDYDRFLISLEAPILALIQEHPFAVDFWDTIYNTAWIGQLITYLLLVGAGRDRILTIQYTSTYILVFHLGRFWGVLTPVLGPALYQPELYPRIDGTISKFFLNEIKAIIENPGYHGRAGLLLGGISALPSVHIAMLTIGVYWLYQVYKRSLYATIPWLILVYLSTVILGWHYAIDGLCGVLLACGSIAVIRLLGNLTGLTRQSA